MRGDLTPAIELWILGSPGGLQLPTFGSVGFTLTLSPKWGCDTHGCPGPNTLIDPPPSSTGIAWTSSTSSSAKSWTNWIIDSTRVTWRCWRPSVVLCPLSFHSSIRRWWKNSQAYIGSQWTFRAPTRTSSISLMPSIESWRHSPTTWQWASSISFKLCRTCCSFWIVITTICQWCRCCTGSRLPFLFHRPARSDPFLRWSAS